MRDFLRPTSGKISTALLVVLFGWFSAFLHDQIDLWVIAAHVGLSPTAIQTGYASLLVDYFENAPGADLLVAQGYVLLASLIADLIIGYIAACVLAWAHRRSA